MELWSYFYTITIYTILSLKNRRSLSHEEAIMNQQYDFDTVGITLSNQYSEI